MSEKGMYGLARKNVFSGVKKAQLHKCSHCFVGKKNRVPFKSRLPSKKSEIGDLVHYDDSSVVMMTNKLSRKSMKNVALSSD